MGKAQSKRSVDITTESTKGVHEGSGKLEKIDDKYFKENETSDKENKAENIVTENEKNESVPESESVVATTSVEVLADESVAAEVEGNKNEAITSEKPAEESAPKKEKVKKKWSFRSISFSKKDKQKPSKKDKKNDDNIAVAEDVVEENAPGEIETKAPTDNDSGKDKSQEDKSCTDKEPQAIEVKVSESIEIKAIAESSCENPQDIVDDEDPAPVSKEEPVAEAKEPIIEIETPIAPILKEEVAMEPVKEETTNKVVEEPIDTEPIVISESVIEEPRIEKSEIIEEPAKFEIESQPIVEEPPAVPASPPPSQFHVFAESMNVPTTEESLEPVDETKEIVESEPTIEGAAIEMEIEVEQIKQIDVEPVAELIEKVLEEAVDRIETETAPIEEPATIMDTDSLPDPPIELINNVPVPTLDIAQPKPVEKLENGVHNGDTKPECDVKMPELIEEIKKEDKVSDKISPEQALAPEIISE